MAKAIVLWGKGQRGKTQTLNLVILKLMQVFRATLIGGVPASDITVDSHVVLNYNGKKIGIITNGDDGITLNKYFSLLPPDCDIYVCASRTKGSSCKYLAAHFRGNNILWEEKWTVTGDCTSFPCLDYLQNSANDIQALGIVEAIKSV